MNLKYNYKNLSLPEHIAIIMDGNGRWAKMRGKKRTFGHKEGAKTLKETTKLLYEIGVKELTVYAFSTENWKRPKDEVDYLMSLLKQYLKESIKTAKENNMLVRIIGDRSVFESDTIKMIDELEEVSAAFTGMKLNIAVNYGGRDEIVRAINAYISSEFNSGDFSEKDSAKVSNANALNHRIKPITAEILADFLDTKDSPDPELIIRTSGEQRTSNFLLWQAAYSEFFFTETLWPDFSEDDIYEAITFFNKTERRFGGIK